jgi:hypothetical protein
MLDINDNETEIYLAVTNLGKISMLTYDLWENETGLYFLYGPCEDVIYLDDFEEVD